MRLTDPKFEDSVHLYTITNVTMFRAFQSDKREDSDGGGDKTPPEKAETPPPQPPPTKFIDAPIPKVGKNAVTVGYCEYFSLIVINAKT